MWQPEPRDRSATIPDSENSASHGLEAAAKSVGPLEIQACTKRAATAHICPKPETLEGKHTVF